MGEYEKGATKETVVGRHTSGGWGHFTERGCSTCVAAEELSSDELAIAHECKLDFAAGRTHNQLPGRLDVHPLERLSIHLGRGNRIVGELTETSSILAALVESRLTTCMRMYVCVRACGFE